MAVRTWIKVDAITNDLDLIWRSQSQTIAANSAKLWQLYLCRMTPRCYSRILPSKSSSTDYICFGIGHKQNLIDPLLFGLGYMFEKGGGEVKINILKFQSVEQNYDGDLKTYMSNTHHKGEALQYVICRVDPLFTSPSKQNNNNKKHICLSAGLQHFD